MQNGIGLKIPLNYNKIDGPWETTKSYQDTIKQNFKYLLLTNPGERVMEPDFGCGIKNFLFENVDANLYSRISQRIYSQILKYMPFIKIINANADFRDNLLHIKIDYLIDKLQILDSLYLEVSN